MLWKAAFPLPIHYLISLVTSTCHHMILCSEVAEFIYLCQCLQVWKDVLWYIYSFLLLLFSYKSLLLLFQNPIKEYMVHKKYLTNIRIVPAFSHMYNVVSLPCLSLPWELSPPSLQSKHMLPEISKPVKYMYFWFFSCVCKCMSSMWTTTSWAFTCFQHWYSSTHRAQILMWISCGFFFT